MWSIYKNTPPDGNPYHSGPTQDSFNKLRTNSGQTQDKLEMVESITNISVQSLLENNSGQAQDSLLETESASVIGVQTTGWQTQDTQDSFSISAALSPPPVGTGNEVNSTDLNFGVLSCPEFEDEVQNQETVGISEDLKTRDSCPENVLSCPELTEKVSATPTSVGAVDATAVGAPHDPGLANHIEAICAKIPNIEIAPQTIKAGDFVRPLPETSADRILKQVAQQKAYSPDIWQVVEAARCTSRHLLKPPLLLYVRPAGSADTMCPVVYAEECELVRTEETPLQVGDRVIWDECPAHCADLGPFELTAIEGDYGKLDLFSKLVPLSELTKI
jgi:hypothetical protein